MGAGSVLIGAPVASKHPQALCRGSNSRAQPARAEWKPSSLTPSTRSLFVLSPASHQPAHGPDLAFLLRPTHDERAHNESLLDRANSLPLPHPVPTHVQC